MEIEVSIDKFGIDYKDVPHSPKQNEHYFVAGGHKLGKI